MKLITSKKKITNMKADIENRKDYIGGSDIGAIMACNPYKSQYSLWAEKTGLVEPEDLSENEAVWWGNAMEGLVAQRFTEKTGIKMKNTNYVYGCVEFPYLRGHVDRISVKGKIGLECKTTSSWNKTNYAEGEIPAWHWWQCQFYLMLTGYKEWYLATKRDNQFFITKIEPDPEAFDRMIETCTDFWTHVITGEPPEIDDSESTDHTLSMMYQQEVTNFAIDLSKHEDALNALQEIKRQAKDLDSLKLRYTNELKEAMGEAERGETSQYIVTWKTNKGGSRTLKVNRRKEL